LYTGDPACWHGVCFVTHRDERHRAALRCGNEGKRPSRDKGEVMAPLVYKDTSNSARIAVVYITLGALLVVWTVIWSFYLMSLGVFRDVPWSGVGGFWGRGGPVVGVGFGMGRMGRTGRRGDVSEHPPPPTRAPPMAVPVVPAPPPAVAASPTGNPPPQNN